MVLGWPTKGVGGGESGLHASHGCLVDMREGDISVQVSEHSVTQVGLTGLTGLTHAEVRERRAKGLVHHAASDVSRTYLQITRDNLLSLINIALLNDSFAAFQEGQ